MSIQDQLRGFEKTDKFKKLVAEKMKSDPNFGDGVKRGGSKKAATNFGDEMREILRDEILNIRNRDKESFLDHIIMSEEFVSGTGWTISVSFDEDKVTSNSLYWQNPNYELGAYLPVLFNEGYDANNYVYGYNNSGDYIRSSKSLPDRHRDTLYFIQRAVDSFNSKYKGKAVAQYSSKYSGGTLIKQQT